MREIRRPATRITCSAVSADWLCPDTAEPPKIIAGTVAVSRGIPRVIARTLHAFPAPTAAAKPDQKEFEEEAERRVTVSSSETRREPIVGIEKGGCQPWSVRDRS